MVFKSYSPTELMKRETQIGLRTKNKNSPLTLKKQKSGVRSQELVQLENQLKFQTRASQIQLNAEDAEQSKNINH